MARTKSGIRIFYFTYPIVEIGRLPNEIDVMVATGHHLPHIVLLDLFPIWHRHDGVPDDLVSIARKYAKVFEAMRIS